VDFDKGLNFCIRQIREALGDNADSPQYIETLPRRGYRFVAPVGSAGTERLVRFGWDARDPRQIGADADVGVIVTGTLLHAGDGIRVSRRIVDSDFQDPEGLFYCPT
jgi:TolB-like protein